MIVFADMSIDLFDNVLIAVQNYNFVVWKFLFQSFKQRISFFLIPEIWNFMVTLCCFADLLDQQNGRAFFFKFQNVLIVESGSFQEFFQIRPLQTNPPCFPGIVSVSRVRDDLSLFQNVTVMSVWWICPVIDSDDSVSFFDIVQDEFFRYDVTLGLTGQKLLDTAFWQRDVVRRYIKMFPNFLHFCILCTFWHVFSIVYHRIKLQSW